MYQIKLKLLLIYFRKTGPN